MTDAAIAYHDFAPAERARLFRNQRRSVEQSIAVLEAEKMAGGEIDQTRLDDLIAKHGDLTTTIDELEETTA